MRNPALTILYLLPTLALAFSAFIAIKANADFDAYDAAEHRDGMAKVFGSEDGLPSEAELYGEAILQRNSAEAVASWVAFGGAAGYLAPLTVTAIGRSTKNAAKELARSLLGEARPVE